MSVVSFAFRRLPASPSFGAVREWNLSSFFSSGSDKVASKIPKRPGAAFIRFVADNEAVLKASNPNVARSALLKICSERWAGMSPQKKEPYLTEARKDMTAWKEDMNRLKSDQSLTEGLEDLMRQKSETRAVRAVRKAEKGMKALVQDMGRPKQPPTVFAAYFKDNYAAAQSKLAAAAGAGGGNSKPRLVDINKVLAEAWRNERDEVKMKYAKSYSAEREAFLKRLAEWEKRTAGDEKLAKAAGKLEIAKGRKKRLTATAAAGEEK